MNINFTVHVNTLSCFISCLCAVDLCVVLREPDNGNIVAYTNGQRAGSLVIYLCNFGYQIAGSNIRQCLLNGSWTLQDPTCEGKRKLFVAF